MQSFRMTAAAASCSFVLVVDGGPFTHADLPTIFRGEEAALITGRRLYDGDRPDAHQEGLPVSTVQEGRRVSPEELRFRRLGGHIHQVWRSLGSSPPRCSPPAERLGLRQRGTT